MRDSGGSFEKVVIVILLSAGGGLLLKLGASAAPQELQIATYASNLEARTPAQRLNARLAAQAVDNYILPPGGIFSFNHVVGSWSADRGYVRAPVSYDGKLILAFGGGVCQTSSTLYNAALLSGLKILERHHHDFVAHYVPPGRDAAVAQYNIDLRFQNPYPWALRIRCYAAGYRLVASILAPKRPAQQVEVVTQVLERTEPERLTRTLYRNQFAGTRAYVRNPGSEGYRTLTWRIFSQDGKDVRRQLLGDDTYGAMNRIVQIVEGE